MKGNEKRSQIGGPTEIMNASFYEMMLDGMGDAIYVLDNKGNYLYANTAYCQHMKMSREEILSMNVHDFLRMKEINFCIFDTVMDEKRQVIRFQDVFDSKNIGRRTFRQLVVQTLPERQVLGGRRVGVREGYAWRAGAPDCRRAEGP